jgi:hypothetical protein
MRTYLYLPAFLVALLGVFLFGLTFPTGGPVIAEEGEEGEDDGPGEFYEDETTFSGKEVTKAINKGVAWLRKKQGRNGSWGGISFNSTYGGQQQVTEGMLAGPTPLALYTLLKCKQPLKDPVIRRGFSFMKDNYKIPPTSYETSMLLLAVTATADRAKMSRFAKKLPPPKLTGQYRSWANKLVDDLVDRRTARGWRYNVKGQEAAPGGPEDLSSTQLAALSLFAAHRCGIKVKRQVWEDILSFSMEQQEDDGPEVTYKDPIDPNQDRTANSRGFSYIKGAENADEAQPRGGMTACGLANIEMARFVLTKGGKERESWNKRDDAEPVQKAIFDGLAWLDKNWSPFADPHARRMNVYHVYWLYALERAMDLLSLKLVGSHNWYNEMGQELLNRQHSDGRWDTKGKAGHDVLDTCFALLFLKRATKGSIPFGSVTGGSEDPPVDNR